MRSDISNRPLPPRARIIMVSEIDWDYLWQRHQIFATMFAERGYCVYYLNRVGVRFPAVREIPRLAGKILKGLLNPGGERKSDRKNLVVISPVILPPVNRFANFLNRYVLIPRLINGLGGAGAPTVLYTYLPTEISLALADWLRPDVLVYDCVQNWREHPRAPKNIAEVEELLLQRADAVLADSNYLVSKLRKYRGDVVQVPPGVDFHAYRAAFRGDEWGKAPRRLCYYGRVRCDLDIGLINCLAEAGNWGVELIGSVDPLLNQDFSKKVKLQPPVDHQELPRKLKSCDVLLLPYAVNDFTRGIIPAKFFECLAMGKPILATALPSFKDYAEVVNVIDSPRAAVRTLQNLSVIENAQRARARMALAKRNGWENRVARILGLAGNAYWKKING